MSMDGSDFDDVTASYDAPLDDDGRAPLAMAAGLVAALVAGGIWAALVLTTNMEIGYAAWGVGGLVGFAMSRVTNRRSRGLAVTAAGLALAGLVAGKAFIFAGSAGSIAEDLAASDEAMTASVAWQMYDARELDDATLAAVDAVAEGDPVPDPIWADMQQQATSLLATLSPEQKYERALTESRLVMKNVGVLGGIRAQLSMFDLLWVLLAVGTAFRMMAGEGEMEAAV